MAYYNGIFSFRYNNNGGMRIMFQALDSESKELFSEIEYQGNTGYL